MSTRSLRPLIEDVTRAGRPDVISIGFAIALWSGSRAVNVFIDTITVMYGLDGHRGIVATRPLAFLLYIVALLIGAVVLPLAVVGPDRVVELVPWGTEVVAVLYWPVVILLSIAFLTTLYHVSVPVRSPWVEDVPGALVALAMWVLGSFLLRIYLTGTVEGPTIYGSLAAPIAVLLWIGISAFAVLVGAAVNAAIDRVWPSVTTAAARCRDRARPRGRGCRAGGPRPRDGAGGGPRRPRHARGVPGAVVPVPAARRREEPLPVGEERPGRAEAGREEAAGEEAAGEEAPRGARRPRSPARTGGSLEGPPARARPDDPGPAGEEPQERAAEKKRGRHRKDGSHH